MMKRKKKIIIVSIVLCLLIGIVGGLRWRAEYGRHLDHAHCLVDAYMSMYNITRHLRPPLRDPELDFRICPPAAKDLSKEYKDTPPNTMISWRLSDASATYCGGDGSQEKWRYEEPYDSDHNRHQWNGTFCWGARPAAGKERPEDYWTNVMGITGPDTAFDLQTLKKLDSCGHLIFAVSVKNSGVHWAEPGDLDVRNLPADLRKGIDGKGFHALFLDGTVWFIRKDVPMELLENFLTASRARKNNRNDKLIRYAKELHHGGHFPSYADRCEEYERD